jgi:excinuclease UvrABC helicase subunit UvrB
MQLSSQQTAAIDFIKNSNKSLILSAVAGAGKTSTLLAMLEATEGSVAFCAFNKSIAKEIEANLSYFGCRNGKGSRNPRMCER